MSTFHFRWQYIYINDKKEKFYFEYISTICDILWQGSMDGRSQYVKTAKAEILHRGILDLLNNVEN